VVQIANTPRAILNRQVQHRRLALLSITDAIVTACVSITLALNSFTLWALLAASMSNAFLNILFLFTWRPVWKPRFAWEPKTIRYFLSFGSRSFVARFLLEALDRVDDLWTAVFLGTEPLGYYSRAYRFATYPRAFIAGPIYQVAGGVYAELKGDRVRLSKAFMQVNSLMIRSGFLLAGLLALAAPEIIRIVLGDKWMPMLDAFRLMLVYTLFDPIKQTVANLFNAMGLPETVLQIRAVQFLVMVSGLFLLGFRFGIAGIALAVDIMLVFGIILFFQKAKTHVDYSLKELLVTPTVALFFGLVTGFVAAQWHGIAGNDWLTGAAKAILFTIVYGSILMLWDRRQVNEIWALVGRYLIKR
jgi:O-antigen/teichoic acid export membrane protein